MIAFKIKSCKGYYEIYIDGEFYCSVDNLTEAAKEIELYESDYS